MASTQQVIGWDYPGAPKRPTPAAPGTSGSDFNLHPSPTGGNGAYGLVPGQLGLPDPYKDLSGVLPNLSGLNAQAGQDVLGQLSGQLSPETINQLQDQAAQFGITSGMPGSNLAGRSGLKNLGLSVEGLQNQGLQNYNSLIPTVSHTQTVSPDLQNNIADRNSIFASAPDPGAAARAAEDAFNRGRGPMAGFGGGGASVNPGMPNLSLPSHTETGAYGAGGGASRGTGPSVWGGASYNPAPDTYSPMNGGTNSSGGSNGGYGGGGYDAYAGGGGSGFNATQPGSGSEFDIPGFPSLTGNGGNTDFNATNPFDFQDSQQDPFDYSGQDFANSSDFQDWYF